MRIRIKLSYDGQAFCGFQVQNNAESVQGALCRALATLCREDVPVSGCSRTDAGVHAREFFCHADVSLTSIPETFVKSLNALLPDEISVFSCEEAASDFHARYSATKKTYRYYITNAVAPHPLLRRHTLHVKGVLDTAAMRRAAEQLVGTHDFAAFQAAGSKVRDTVRTVTHAAFSEPTDDTFYFEISADGFLYRMVRNIVGTLLDLGQGKEYDIPTLLNEKDRTKAGKCAPPHALYLWQVDYE